MSLSFEGYLVAALFLVYIDLLIIIILFINRLKGLGRREQFMKEKHGLIKILSLDSGHKSTGSLLNSYTKMKESILLDQENVENIEGSLDLNKVENKNIRRLKSWSKLRRMESTVNLGFIATDRAREALEKAILKETSFPVKLYMANALSDIKNKKSIPVLVETLINAHRWYRNRLNMLIADFGYDFYDYLPQIADRKEVEIKELIVDFASLYFSVELKDYLLRIIDEAAVACCGEKNDLTDRLEKSCRNCIYGRKVTDDGNRLCKYKGIVSPDYKCRKFRMLPVSIDERRSCLELAYKAAGVMADFYPKVMADDKYLNSTDPKIRKNSVKALSQGNSYENLDRVVSFLYDEETAMTSVNCISKMIGQNPELIKRIIKRFVYEENVEIKRHLAEILSRKIEYFIMKLVSRDKKIASDIIHQVLILGKTSNIIDFLNKNKNVDIENELIEIVRDAYSKDVSLKKEFCKYLNERLLKKCGINPIEDPITDRSEKKDQSVIRLLYSVIFVIILIFPIIYLLRYSSQVLKLPFITQLKTYIVDFNYYIAFYSIAINLVYILLLLLSFFNVRRQSKLWKLKSMSLLFKTRMLPGISIIAPAYNEEKTIIESANSLLNLVYPDYELIIVNDGSKDGTMDVLIKNFDLKRVDYVFDYKLNTKSVRGVYMNRSMPKLIVVDKENGGKADSLNAGINISRKEYFCGIDADSLLESDALLKLASMELDAGVETPALGGNIFPANGCSINKGVITDIRIPQNKLARFQTIEYIRAFMAGRLGWAYTNNLLIISGAFGLFRKERVISVWGYLTSSGKYEKDTVGEDMELVVRIVRFMREKGLRYKIDYAYNANCWTEVPEELNSLKKQRYRWQRGLIDILTFHRKMIFNPAYGRTGLVAMPYFFIFEMVGPLIEIQGLFMVIIASLLGLLNPQIALLLFVSTVLMGILISLSSLLIAEKDTEYFTLKEIFVLIFYAIIENFGPRQLFSFWRVAATLRMLWIAEGWGKLERKGFAAPGAAVKG